MSSSGNRRLEMNSSECCIVNVATKGRDQYLKGQQRLMKSLESFGCGVRTKVWTGEFPDGSPTHESDPYAFKVTAIREAVEAGFTYILWLDASAWAVSEVTPVFEHIKEYGWLFQYSGHTVNQWINDETLEKFGMTREDASMMLLYMGGIFGLNMENAKAEVFLEEMEECVAQGMFRGSWANHRHDMSCGSVVACKLGMPLQPSNKFLILEKEKTRKDLVFCCQGM